MNDNDRVALVVMLVAAANLPNDTAWLAFVWSVILFVGAVLLFGIGRRG